MVGDGWTQADIVRYVEDTTGQTVSRGAVSAALSRAGLTVAKARYKEELPWRVSEEHQSHYAARMLRLLGRQRAGDELRPEEQKRLTSWRHQLEDWGAVVAYSPTQGFLYVHADEVGDGAEGIPIRRRTITDDELY